jgi:hypothetical protein
MVVIVLKQVFVNQYSCLVGNTSLVTKCCSVEKAYFQVVKLNVNLFVCIQLPMHNA